jgi:hypothetical protein
MLKYLVMLVLLFLAYFMSWHIIHYILILAHFQGEEWMTWIGAGPLAVRMLYH